MAEEVYDGAIGIDLGMPLLPLRTFDLLSPGAAPDR